MVAPDRPAVPGARLAVGLATRLLPTAADRRRYYSEFVAELYGQAPADQYRHVTGVLAQTFALRTALRTAPARREEVAMEPLGRRLRCQVLHWHHWKVFSTEDGQRYSACSVCRKEHRDVTGPPDMIGGVGW